MQAVDWKIPVIAVVAGLTIGERTVADAQTFTWQVRCAYVPSYCKIVAIPQIDSGLINLASTSTSFSFTLTPQESSQVLSANR